LTKLNHTEIFHPMKNSLTFCFLLCGLSSMAQQDPQFSQNMFNRLPINAAVAGGNDAICATLLYRQQWLGFLPKNEGIPKTGLISLDAPIKMLHGGLGLTIISDKIGFESGVGLKLAYAYRMNVGSGKLALGVDAGILQKGISPTWVAVNMSDPNLPSATSAISPDFGFGAYYNNNNLYAGFSTTHLAEGAMKLGPATYGIARHYYIVGGYNYELNPTWTLKPSFWAKTDFASTQLDVNVTALYNNLIWGGVSYRMKDAIVPMVGMNIGNIKVGYSYDYTMSNLKHGEAGKMVMTHEIMLGYCFKPNPTKPLPLNRNVRFL
jgi:type IX secretion system PorP/SprF family membrane protein